MTKYCPLIRSECIGKECIARTLIYENTVVKEYCTYFKSDTERIYRR